MSHSEVRREDPIANGLHIESLYKDASANEIKSVLVSLVESMKSDGEIRQLLAAISRYRFSKNFFDVSSFLIESAPKSKEDQSSKKKKSVHSAKKLIDLPSEILGFISSWLNIADQKNCKLANKQLLFDFLFSSNAIFSPSQYLRQVNKYQCCLNVARSSKTIIYRDANDVSFYAQIPAPSCVSVISLLSPNYFVWNQVNIERLNVKKLDYRGLNNIPESFIGCFSTIFPNLETLKYCDVGLFSVGLMPDINYPPFQFEKLKKIMVTDPGSVLNFGLVKNPSLLTDITVVGNSDTIHLGQNPKVFFKKHGYSFLRIEMGEWVDNQLLIEMVKVSPNLTRLEFSRNNLVDNDSRFDPAMSELSKLLVQRHKLESLIWRGESNQIIDAMEWSENIVKQWTFEPNQKKSFEIFFLPRNPSLFGPSENVLERTVEDFCQTLNEKVEEWRLSFTHPLVDSYIDWKSFGFFFEEIECFDDEEIYVSISNVPIDN